MRDFLTDLAKRVGRGRTVTCLITTDTELRRLNREFRKKDYATDVLSFPAGPTTVFFGDPEGPGLAGDLAISLEPAGGSSTGVPTGPVLFTGKLVESLPGSPS